MQGIDPLAPDIARWIAGKSDEDELIIRLAFLELFPCCRHYRPWIDRTEELSRSLIFDGEDEDRFAWRAELLCDGIERWLAERGLGHSRYLH
jgi:hypothetical protein